MQSARHSVWKYFSMLSLPDIIFCSQSLWQSPKMEQCAVFSQAPLRSHRVWLFSVSVNCLFFLVRKDYAFMYDVILLKFCNPLTTEGWKTPKYHLCYGLYHQYLPVNNNLKIPTWFGFAGDLPSCKYVSETPHPSTYHTLHDEEKGFG